MEVRETFWAKTGGGGWEEGPWRSFASGLGVEQGDNHRRNGSRTNGSVCPGCKLVRAQIETLHLRSKGPLCIPYPGSLPLKLLRQLPPSTHLTARTSQSLRGVDETQDKSPFGAGSCPHGHVPTL